MKKVKIEQHVPVGFGGCPSGEITCSAGEQHFACASPASQSKKLCRVCGDKALNVNFNVVTCESCKAFFRRNATKQKEFRCSRNGACVMTTESRKTCKRCRLRKCFEVGMIKEWIMTDEERIQKRQLIETNREKRRSQLTVASSAYDQPYGKIPKMDPADSMSTTSRSVSPNERPSTTSTTDRGVIESVATTNTEGMISPAVADTAGGNSFQHFPRFPSMEEDDSIWVPKSVFLKLIKTCEQNSKEACSQCPPPPVLIHAWRLYESGSIVAGDSINDDSTSRSPTLKCACQCTCGARSDPVDHTNMENGGSERKEEVPNDHSMNGPVFGEEATSSSSSKPVPGQFDYNAQIEPSRGDQSDPSLPCSRLTDTITTNEHIARELLLSRQTVNGIAADLGYAHLAAGYRHLITDAAEAVRITHAYVGRIVSMFRRLSPFRALTTADQIVLLQGGIREQLMIQSVITYNSESDAWLPFGRNQPYEIPLDIFSKFRSEQLEPHSSFLRSFAPEWSSDDVLMQAMAAVSLFEPNRQGVTDRATIAQQQHFYQDFMREYLMLKYGPQDGLRIYSELQARLNWMRTCIGQMQPNYHLELAPADLQLLMFELLL